MATKGAGMIATTIAASPKFRWLTRAPEHDRPQGDPRWPAVRTGCTYARELAHASAWLDLEKQTGEITRRCLRPAYALQ